MQTYLSMLCVFKWGIFMFFAGMVVVMTITVAALYPETKGLPIEEAPHVFADHWCAPQAWLYADCLLDTKDCMKTAPVCCLVLAMSRDVMQEGEKLSKQ
jgi:hypothetical protein